jgi:hypothetical protein
MSDTLVDGLAATANQPTADTPSTPDAALDAVFDAPEAPAASEPSDPSAPVPEPAAATAQPLTPTDPNAKGEPPRERWDSILENARRKEREATLATYKDHLEVVKRLQEDFPGTLAQLLEEGSIDPRFSEQLTSRAAAILAARNKTAKADAEPEPDLQTSDGALVYSADQLRKWHQWNTVQTEKTLTAKFAPLQQLQQRFEQHQQTQKLAQEAATVAEKRGAQWKEMPFFAEHQPAIVARQAEIYAEMQGQPGFDPVGSPWDALQQAYREVITTQALPKLQSQQTDSLVASAQRKRAANSSDPSASAPAQPRKPRTVDEALDQVFDGIAV